MKTYKKLFNILLMSCLISGITLATDNSKDNKDQQPHAILDCFKAIETENYHKAILQYIPEQRTQIIADWQNSLRCLPAGIQRLILCYWGANLSINALAVPTDGPLKFDGIYHDATAKVLYCSTVDPQLQSVFNLMIQKIKKQFPTMAQPEVLQHARTLMDHYLKTKYKDTREHQVAGCKYSTDSRPAQFPNTMIHFTKNRFTPVGIPTPTFEVHAEIVNFKPFIGGDIVLTKHDPHFARLVMTTPMKQEESKSDSKQA